MQLCRKCGFPVSFHRDGQCAEPEDGWHTCEVCGADVYANQPDLSGVADTCPPDRNGCPHRDCPFRA